MVKITNTTPGDLWFEGVNVPAVGSVNVSPETIKAGKRSPVVQGWFNGGKLVADEPKPAPTPKPAKGKRRNFKG